MSSAVSSGQWRPPVRTERHEALETLSLSVRRLVEATVGTGGEAAELRAVAAEVDELARQLEKTSDDDPWATRSYGAGVTDMPSLMGINPAIGNCNPSAPVVRLNIAEDGSVIGTVHFRLSHVGPPYRAHGGMVAMVFDQVLGVAAIAANSPGMTATMTVKYRRATPLREDLRIEARRVGGQGRTTHATGEIYDADGEVTAEAEAMFIKPRGEMPRGGKLP